MLSALLSSRPASSAPLKPLAPQPKFGMALAVPIDELVKSTVTVFKRNHPDLSGLSHWELTDLLLEFARQGHPDFQLSRSELADLASAAVSSNAAKREIELKLTTGQSNSTAAWIDTNEGPRVLGCVHATIRSGEDIRLPSGRAVAHGEPSFYADQNPLTPGDLINQKWELEVARSPRGTVTDPVNDLAVFRKTGGEEAPTPLPLADEDEDVWDWLGEQIMRIGRFGRVVPGRSELPEYGSTQWYANVPGFDQEELRRGIKAVVTGETHHGDSGGPMLRNGKLFAVTTDFVGYNGRPLYSQSGEYIGRYSPNGLSGTGAKGPETSTIMRFLRKHGLVD